MNVRRLVSLVVVVLALVGAFVAQRVQRHAAEADLETEVRRRAREVGSQAAEAIHAAHRELEVKASGAAMLPVLAPQLDADRRLRTAPPEDKVDAQRTVARLFEDADEPFAKYHGEFPVYGVLSENFDEYLHGVDRASMHAELLIANVRARGASSGLVYARGQLLLVALAPIIVPPLNGESMPAPLVLLGKPLDAALLDRIASRIAGAVLLTDGHKLLGEAGPSDARVALAGLVGQEGSHEIVDPAMHWGASAVEIAPGVFLWAAVDTVALAEARFGALRTQVAVTWVVSGLVALAALALGFRSRREPAATLEQTQVSLRRIGEGPAAGKPGPQNVVPLPLTQAAPAAGQTFGRYVLVDRLGSGGMGDVYLAVAFGAEGFRRNFVIKRLRAELSRDPKLVTQFIDEARLSASLVHANIIPVFDFGKVGDEYFMAQEYINGRDLEHFTTRSLEVEGKPLPPHLLFHAAREVLKALSYAHSKTDEQGRLLGLVHRDISPQNVMISSRGEVKLFDFGIVKTTARSTQTEAGVVKGNVNYMAPEQARGLELDRRADLFALGLVLYRCLAGETLYRDATTYDQLVHAATGLSAEDLRRVEALPGPAAEVLKRALATDPNQRFSEADDFAAALPPGQPHDAAELAERLQRLFGAELEAERSKLVAAAPNTVTDPGLSEKTR